MTGRVLRYVVNGCSMGTDYAVRFRSAQPWAPISERSCLAQRI